MRIHVTLKGSIIIEALLDTKFVEPYSRGLPFKLLKICTVLFRLYISTAFVWYSIDTVSQITV